MHWGFSMLNKHVNMGGDNDKDTDKVRYEMTIHLYVRKKKRCSNHEILLYSKRNGGWSSISIGLHWASRQIFD